MKLRTTYNSIRIRVRKSELATLEQNFKVKESITFPNGVFFEFALSIQKNVEELTAIFDNHQLIVIIPFNKAQHWIKTNQVGIENHVAVANGKSLHLLIEKDFPCLDRKSENKTDTFWELAPQKQPKVC